MIRSNDSHDASKKNENNSNNSNGKLIRAIFSDYDGTLCSASAARRTSLGQTRIPLEIKNVLQEISSEQIPVCIISSKDYFFLKETRTFAKVISCLMGIEMLTFPSVTTATTVDQEQQESPPIRRNLLVDREEESEIFSRSYVLEEIAKSIESEPDFRSVVVVERKYTSDKRILAGLTVDWRYSNNWDYYKKIVQHFVSALVTNLSEPSMPIYLYIQKYNFHPFVDVYIKECNKGTAFDFVLSEISYIPSFDYGEKNEYYRENGRCIIRAEDVLYLGDSENDNPAFEMAGVSIGVRSNSRIIPKLDCQHTINFDRLDRFLRKLKDNHFRFNKKQLMS